MLLALHDVSLNKAYVLLKLTLEVPIKSTW